MSTLSDWIDEVARELGIDELGELVDPEVVQPLVLDMTRDVAHGVARPAAPITAYLLGLAAGGRRGRARGAGARAGLADLAGRARAARSDGAGRGEPAVASRVMTSDDRWGSVSADQDAAGDGDADELAQLLAMAGGADDAGSGPGGGALADALSQGVTTGPTDDTPGHESTTTPSRSPRCAPSRPSSTSAGPRRASRRRWTGSARSSRCWATRSARTRSIHVAGTNGKSSVTRMIDALLTRIGPRTGRYTSPHLQRVTERIALDGVPISARPLRRDLPRDRAVPRHRRPRPGRRAAAARSSRCSPAWRSPPSPTPRSTSPCSRSGSAGAGTPPTSPTPRSPRSRRSTSTTSPTSAPTSPAIAAREGRDHQGGRGRAARRSRPPRPPRCCSSARWRSSAEVARSGLEFGVLGREVAVGGQQLRLQGLGGEYDDIYLPLFGEHQAANAALALATVEAFFGAGPSRRLDITAVREAFASVRVPGRLERLRSAPTVVVDAAHNPHGARAAAAGGARGVLVPPADRRRRGDGRQGRRRASSPRWSRCSTRW